MAMLVLGISTLELSGNTQADEKPATLPDKSVGDEVARALQQQRERISTIRLRWTLVQVDAADAALDTEPDGHPTTEVELRWAKDGRYFYHAVQTRNAAAEFRRVQCSDGERVWRADYPPGESHLQHPNRMTWAPATDPRQMTFLAVPLQSMGFPWIGDFNTSGHSLLPSLGDVEIDGETCHRFGMPERLEEIRSPRYGWQAISSFSLSGPMRGMRNWRREQTWVEFSEIESGLWLPHRGRINQFADANPSFEIWSIDSVEINPRLTDAEFRIPVVEGTPVSRAEDANAKPPAPGAPVPMPAVVEDDTDQWKWNLGLAAACILALVGLWRWCR